MANHYTDVDLEYKQVLAAAPLHPVEAPGRCRMEKFSIGDDVSHRVGDAQCSACATEFPEPCRCGGLVHASLGEEEDLEGNALMSTRCDQCGRTDEDLAEAV
jgi:hypothetical protein